jgi:hypothetical protein
MPVSARRDRGQAIVEAVLGILVFVSVLMFGLHFAEVTFTQMKVTEAAQSAVWDSTSGQMHVLPDILGNPFGNFGGAGANVNTAMLSASGRYADFDGRSTVATNPTPKQIFSSARPGSMNVTCRINAGLPQKGAHAVLFLHELAAYRDNDGYTCQADAWVDPVGTMRVGSFLEDANGFFGGTARARHKNSVTQTAGYHICAVNKANGLNGPCRGEFAGLIDDWGLASGGKEAAQCPVMPYGIPCVLPGANNTNFWTSAMLMYELNALLGTQNNADYNMVRLVGTPPPWVWNGIPLLPGNPTSFYLSFMGESTQFIGLTPWVGDFGWFFGYWTTPYGLYFPTYTAAYVQSKGFYLGQDASISTIQNP